MASTRSSTQADLHFDGDAAPTGAKDQFTDVEEALAMLVHATYPPDAQARGPAPDRSAEARTSHAFGAGMLGAADLRPPIPREQRSRGQRGTLRRAAIMVCLGASAIWAWRSYGGPAADIIATAPPFGWIAARPSADPPPAPQAPDPAPAQVAAARAIETPPPPPAHAASDTASQAESQTASQSAPDAPPATTAANAPSAAWVERQQLAISDLAALRRTVAQLAAGQEQLTHKLAKLQAEKLQTEKLQAEKLHADKPPAEKPDKRTQHRASAHPAPPAAKPARKLVATTPPQAARRASTVGPVSPPPQPVPQLRAEAQSANLTPLRPPMPVPQP